MLGKTDALEELAEKVDEALDARREHPHRHESGPTSLGCRRA
jgi:hypothetical protein